MSGPRSSNHSRPSRSLRRARLAMSIILAAAAALAVAAPLSAASVANSWQARVGSAGVNGTVTIQAYAGGTGSIAIRVIKLKPSRALEVVISKGTCKAVGSTLLTLPSIRTTSKGAATRTSNLSAAQIKAVVAATRGTGKIVIRFGSGASRKCGQFASRAPVVVVPAVAATIPVGVYPQHVALDATGIWVTNAAQRSLSRIDPTTNTVLSVSAVVLPGDTFPEGIATGFGSIWVSTVTFDDPGTGFLAGSVVRLDPRSGSVVGSPIPVGREAMAIAVSPEAVWVSNYVDGTVSRIDPTTNQVTATISLGGHPVGIAAGYGSIWVADDNDGKVSRIDPVTNQVAATIQTRENAEGVAIGAGSVWVANYGTEGQPGGVISRIDPATNSVVAAVPVGVNPGFLAFGGGYLWVAMVGEPTAVQVDPATNSVRNRVDVGAKAWGIGASDHAVWVVHPAAAGTDPSSGAPGTVTRINF
jgi:YVTN family beta-propeller protein